MQYILSFGSNREEGPALIGAALEHLMSYCRLSRLSPFYITPAMGGGKRPYFNAVAVVETDDGYSAFNARCKKIEYILGRDSMARACGDVPIDLDIVVAEQQIMRPADYSQEFFRIGMKLLALKQ